MRLGHTAGVVAILEVQRAVG
eukprot:SAG11_NODE_22137_length_411_cov_1.105769_1_plen_20_part_01